MRARAAIAVLAVSLCASVASSAAPLQPFSVADDIAIRNFGDLFTGGGTGLVVSPDGKSVVVHTEHGSVEDSRLHDELRVYDVEALRDFVNGSSRHPAPEPRWKLAEFTNQNGQDSSLVKKITWLRDSSGFVFLLHTEQGQDRLMFADSARQMIEPLTADTQDITGFSVRDRRHYAFTVRATEMFKQRLAAERSAPAQVKTGQGIWDAVFSEPDGYTDRSDLWAVNGGTPGPILDPSTGKPYALYYSGTMNLVLSPDGRTLITELAVADIPQDWVARFPPPESKGAAYGLVAGRQDLQARSGVMFVSQYVVIDVDSGRAKLAASSPDATRAGWWASFEAPAWSDDSRAVILPAVFPPAAADPTEIRPCLGVLSVENEVLQCVAPLKRNLSVGFEPGYERDTDAVFAPGRDDRLIVKYLRMSDSGEGAKSYTRTVNGAWEREELLESATAARAALDVKIRMSFKDPPVLLATDPVSHKSKVIWDPNPQLRQLALGDASLYHWKDATGRGWNAILFKPVGYVPGTRYPLVIQNHGYNDRRFTASGGFPTTFAAQELAAAGIAVLQMRDCEGRMSPIEGLCNVTGYDSGIEQLANEGLIDPKRVGIMGFSRTVFYVMEALTTGKAHFQAASIADGINIGYFQHLLDVGYDEYTREDYSMIGAPPFGAGLQQWLQHSPEFNVDKISTPLRIVGMSRSSLLSMWEPYALLQEMHKPVDLIQLSSKEHILTDPTIRLASQGGSVEWFRFWLQGYESPDPAKAEQYRRWEGQCDLQRRDQGGFPTFCVPSEH